MTQVSFSQTAHAEKIHDGKGSTDKNAGVLDIEGKTYSVVDITDPEISADVSEFLEEANMQKKPVEELAEHEFVHITPETVEVETEIEHLFQELAKMGEGGAKGVDKQKTEQKPLQNEKPSERSKSEESRSNGGSPLLSPSKEKMVYSSLFALARSINAAATNESRSKMTAQEKTEKEPLRQEKGLNAHSPLSQVEENIRIQEERFEWDWKEKEEGEGGGQHQEEEKRREQEKKKKGLQVGSVQAARSGPEGQKTQGAIEGPGTYENIYLRFMALMARILGQAELEAHQLYLRIKERTDAIDVLTDLISKINSEKAAIDWTKNEEMKALVDKARELGVDIPEGKYKWTADEKKLLKENVQMRKDSMEKITQLERTDMQRYLQEASQCHQARSNILKMLKEVVDTIVHNLRPS